MEVRAKVLMEVYSSAVVHLSSMDNDVNLKVFIVHCQFLIVILTPKSGVKNSAGFRVSQNKLHGQISNSKYLNHSAIGYSFLKNFFT